MELRCPKCNRFVAEGSGFVRGICPRCKIEVQATAPEQRVRA